MTGLNTRGGFCDCITPANPLSLETNLKASSYGPFPSTRLWSFLAAMVPSYITWKRPLSAVKQSQQPHLGVAGAASGAGHNRGRIVRTMDAL